MRFYLVRNQKFKPLLYYKPKNEKSKFIWSETRNSNLYNFLSLKTRKAILFGQKLEIHAQRVIFSLKICPRGNNVKTEDYGISYTCYPYTPILIRLPPKFQPYPTSRADIVELRNCFAVESQPKNKKSKLFGKKLKFKPLLFFRLKNIKKQIYFGRN